MADAWGGAFGVAWGVSWGTTAPAVVLRSEPDPLARRPHGKRKYWRWEDNATPQEIAADRDELERLMLAERLARQGKPAVKPAPVAKPVQVDPEEDDEMAIIMMALNL